MLSVTDIIKILEKIPLWQTMAQMPKRIEALEARIALLEKSLAAPPAKPGPKCPICDGTLKVTKVAPHPVFGKMGHQEHTLTCTGCDHTETRKIVPGTT